MTRFSGWHSPGRQGQWIKVTTVASIKNLKFIACFEYVIPHFLVFNRCFHSSSQRFALLRPEQKSRPFIRKKDFPGINYLERMGKSEVILSPMNVSSFQLRLTSSP